MTPPSSLSLKPKTPNLLNLSDYKKVHPFVKKLFKETRETFPLAGKLQYFLKSWEEVTNDSTILSIETPNQPKTPTRAKLNQVRKNLYYRR